MSANAETGFLGKLVDWIEGGPEKRARTQRDQQRSEALAQESARLQTEMERQLQLAQMQQMAVAQAASSSRPSHRPGGAESKKGLKNLWVPLALGGGALVLVLLMRRR